MLDVNSSMRIQAFVVGAFFSVLLGSLGAWVTHVVVCISDDRWGFLIAGAVFFPVGVVHGIGVWLGVW